MVAHEADDEAVQAHPAVVVTATLPLPPAAVKEADIGAMLYEQAVPDWAIGNCTPPMVRLPDRPAPGLAATLNFTVPLPVPLVPALIEIQAMSADAVHVQPACVVTA